MMVEFNKKKVILTIIIMMIEVNKKRLYSLSS